ncbi:DUF5916 domain-containing protein [Aquimarina hainanensis]|uniref:DUF5916 domain-containing protein n=1 Tax=Aquimarina hainanensis TaxID=1578017 RepID=A0ABW5NBU2_9FLAO|nr:DUF5916 domain-containing protein [Aquimarina sp. TRL1]QKX06604.1 carbohydrate binding family 9 domain-containing protein [Aquimarina sp. TRL1]
MGLIPVNNVQYKNKWVFLFCVFSLWLKGYTQKEIQIHFTEAPVKVDGVLDKDEWEPYMIDGYFIQNRPDNGEKSKRRTKIGVQYDNTYIYVAAKLFVESKEEINAQLTARDNTGNTDFFGIQMDPFGRAREGYDFTVTAAGVQSDEKLSEFSSYRNFNVIWKSNVMQYDTYWTVEMRIPFNSIRFSKDDMSNFRINFQRFSSKLNESSYWNHIDANIDGFLNQFGKLTGIKKVHPPLNLSLFPFVSSLTERRGSSGTKTSFTGGLDMKYVHNNAYTLDVSMIPDFSQAQSDDQVFNLSPFEVRFNENRQFFIEGTEIFDKGGYIYTRRIGGTPIDKNNLDTKENEEIISNPLTANILNLVKVTGKSSGGLSVGVLNGVTAESEAEIRDTITNTIRKETTNPLTNYTSVVLDQALRNNGSVTLVNNSVLRNGVTYDANLSALLYRWYNKNRTYSMYFKKAVSQQYFSDEKNVFGHQYFGRFSKVSGKWTGNISLNMYDDDFDINDFGFLARNNQLQFQGNLQYTNPSPKKTFANYQVGATHRQRYYYSLMENELATYRLYGNARFKKNNHVIYTSSTYGKKRKDFYEPRKEGYYFVRPAFAESFFEYQTNRNKNISFAGYIVGVKFLNNAIYKNAIHSGYGIRARLGQHFSAYLAQNYSYNPGNAGYIDTEEDTVIFGERSTKELTNRLHLNYAVNAKVNINARLRHYWFQADYRNQYSLTKRGELQKNDLDINVDSYDKNFNAFTIDVLARWQFAPASEISLGYKMGTNRTDKAVGSSYTENFDSVLSTDSNHSFTMKLTYFLDTSLFKKRGRK